MSSSVETRDLGLDRILRELRNLDGIKADSGIFAENTRRTDGAKPGNAGLMAIHEFGAPRKNIPQRSVLRATVKRKNRQLEQQLNRNIGKVIDNQLSPMTAMKRVAFFLTTEFQRTIARSIGLAPNKASTVARKGSGKPLVATKQMKGAFSERVTR